MIDCLPYALLRMLNRLEDEIGADDAPDKTELFVYKNSNRMPTSFPPFFSAPRLSADTLIR